ncbi:MAG TPA: hypothetical protein VFB62_13150 [Polyangiaceae bacterium]|jgi:hypothetical protein|nr:hypothetical protein [Polyangiaceae bacterium]
MRWTAAALLVLVPTVAAAEEARKGGLEGEDAEIYKKLSEARGTYVRLLLSTSMGAGFRFNNPYRLQTQLGESAESVSVTAPYFDAALGVAFGDPDGFQHGMSAHLAVAVDGVSQQALSGSYLVLYRGPWPALGYARAGTVVLTSPDANVGGELAVGGAYFFTGALGVTAELVGNLFWGADICQFETAAGCEGEAAVIPILGIQGGIIVDYEVLP